MSKKNNHDLKNQTGNLYRSLLCQGIVTSGHHTVSKMFRRLRRWLNLEESLIGICTIYVS